VTYSAFTKGCRSARFDPADAEVLPEDWLATAPGKRLTSVLIRVEHARGRGRGVGQAGRMVRARKPGRQPGGGRGGGHRGDFRIDPAGHMRFAVFVRPAPGRAGWGRIVQRLCEIETYRAMSMLGLMRSRDLSGAAERAGPRLSALVSGLDNAEPRPEAALHNLLTISAELESLAVQFSFRFGATAAYEAIVNQRIEVCANSGSRVARPLANS
jgi:hypothetical protein